MKKNLFSYFITSFGVISFTSKYVFINGLKTKSELKLRLLLQRFDSVRFSNKILCLYGCLGYNDFRGVLLRYLRSGLYNWHITEVYDSFVHNASQIFHGQYSIYCYNTANDF